MAREKTQAIVYTDKSGSAEVFTKYGVFRKGEPNFDVDPKVLEELGAGFEIVEKVPPKEEKPQEPIIPLPDAHTVQSETPPVTPEVLNAEPGTQTNLA